MLGLIVEVALERGSSHRPAVQVALRAIAPERSDEVVLGVGLDPFGDDG